MNSVDVAFTIGRYNQHLTITNIYARDAFGDLDRVVDEL